MRVDNVNVVVGDDRLLTAGGENFDSSSPKYDVVPGFSGSYGEQTQRRDVSSGISIDKVATSGDM